MPIASTLDPQRRVLRATATFPLSFADIRHAVEESLREGTWVYPTLVDAQSVQQIDFSARDMLAVARFVRAALGARPASPCAIVVSRERGFTLARAFASFVAGWMRVGGFD